MTATLLVFVAFVSAGRAFNLEPRHSIVIDDPDQDSSSYFGYALGFWQQSLKGYNTTWLLVGAPKARLEGFTGERVRRPGVVYKCPLGTGKTLHCSSVPVLGHEDRIEQDLQWRRKIKNIPARSWIGGTIAVENKPNGAVVVCAPRMKQMLYLNAWTIPGLCFFLQEDHVIPLARLRTVYPYMQERVTENGFQAEVAQVGISAHFVENSVNSQLVVGATGVNYFRGAVGVYEQDRRWQKKTGLPILHMPTPTEARHEDYMGYSVTSARLHQDGRISYVAGAPRAEGAELFTGAVFILEEPYRAHWRAMSTLRGYQMGEYFGACVVAIDLDMDGLDDLLVVGAPLYYNRRSVAEETTAYDQGQVYVYVNTGEGRLELTDDIIMGSKVSGARFGTSLAAVGDLNKDGFADVAVGAPYEGSGAVYIYHGQDGGLHGQYSQKIVGSAIRPDLTGFGISIVSGVDVDDNSFNDLAIGSYGSNSAVIVKSYPVINLEASLEPSVKKLNINAINFTVKACLRYTTSTRADKLLDILIEMKIRADPNLRRAVIDVDGYQQNYKQKLQLRLHRYEHHCLPLDITIKGNQVIQPIEVSMDYKIIDDPSVNKVREFCKFCPVTDPHSPSSVSIKVPFANGCKGKNVCRADLQLMAQTSNNREPLVLGNGSKMTLTVNASNSGEPAYLAKMSIILPMKRMLLKMPKNCFQDESEQASRMQVDVILCNLGDPLSGGRDAKSSSVQTDFELDLSTLSLRTSLLTFNVTAWSASEELTPEDNSLHLSIPVKLVSQISIVGNTILKHVILTSKDDSAPTIIPVSHKYEVFNHGPSPVGAVHVVFKVPLAQVRNYGSDQNVFAKLTNPQVTIGTSIFSCEVDYSGLNATSLFSEQTPRWAVDVDEVEQSPGHKVDGGFLRRRRNLDVWSANGTEQERYRVKRMRYLNCSAAGEEDMRTVCVPVTCQAGPLSPGTRADIVLQYYFHRSNIKSMLGDVDVIRLSTIGRVDVVDAEKYEFSDQQWTKIATVETTFLGEVTGDKVAPWILPLSIALGLLLLLVVSKALSNVGFFKRSHKEKLELMKEKVEAEDNFESDDFLQESSEDSILS